MNTSTAIGQLAAALAAAQGKFPHIPKDKVARVPLKAGGSYSYNFAGLPSIIDATRPQLSANGLAVIQALSITGSQVTIHTRLAHASGEWIEESATLTAADDRPQSIGAAATYGRRYALAAMLNLAPDDDMDGEVQDVAPRPRQAPKAEGKPPRPAKAAGASQAAAAKPPAAPAQGRLPDPDDLRARFAAAKTLRELLDLVPLVKQLPEEVQEALRPAYVERQHRLAAAIA